MVNQSSFFSRLIGQAIYDMLITIPKDAQLDEDHRLKKSRRS